MEERYLIDTSAVIKYLNQGFSISGLQFLDKIVDNGPVISFISEVELKVWNPLNPDDALIYQTFVASSDVIGISASIIEQTISIRKNYRIKLPDAFIAATAIANNLILVSDNDKDFKRIDELKYINPGKS